jgi:hypothetical protein
MVVLPNNPISQPSFRGHVALEGLDEVPDLSPYHTTLTQPIAVAHCLAVQGGREFAFRRWGLMAGWCLLMPEKANLASPK